MSTIIGDPKILVEARTAYNTAVEARETAWTAVEGLSTETAQDERDRVFADYDERQKDADERKAHLEYVEGIVEGRKNTPLIPGTDSDSGKDDKGSGFDPQLRGGKEEPVYRPDRGHSFFADMIMSVRNGDADARERLERHKQQVADKLEERDISTTATAGGGFVPPLYMGELFADIPRPGRPFADAVRKMPLPPAGMSITIPRITTGAAVAATTADNAAVNEVDIVEALVTTPVVTIAGQQDVSQQLLDRSDPSIDQIIFADLRSSYDQQLDTLTLSGTGASGQHKGIRAVTSVGTVTYTDSTPTGAELLPKIYQAINTVWSTRYAPADTIVMTPARAAWLASQLSSTFPIFQQGQLLQAAGTQDNGFLQTFAGLRVVIDPSIGQLYGAGTNQDEIYVLRAQDIILMEGPERTRVLVDIGSGTLTVRLQLFAYSAFVSARYPTAIAVISGTGLTTPSF